MLLVSTVAPAALAQGGAGEPADPPADSAEQDESADADESKKLFDEARALAKEGEYEEACPKFEQSHHLHPGIGTLFNLADCNERIGKAASARLQYLEVARLTREAGETKREKVALDRAAALEPKLAKISLVVPEGAEDVEVRVDGKIVSAEDLAKPMPLDRGAHVVTASGKGRKPFHASIVLDQDGQVATVEVFGDGTAVVDDEEDEGTKRDTGKIVAGSILTGLGAISLVAGVALFARVPDSTGTERTGAIVGGIIGVAAAGALLGPGIPILVSGLTDPVEEEPAAETSLRPDLFVGLGTATARWTF